jgi:hypothetical protein
MWQCSGVGAAHQTADVGTGSVVGKAKVDLGCSKDLVRTGCFGDVAVSKAPDKPMPGYTPPGPPDPERMLPALMGGGTG